MLKQVIGSTDVQNWRSQQILGILVILFFGTIAISYIIFVNTYFFRKVNSGSLLDSQWFKIPMFGMVFISSIIIFTVMNNSNDTEAKSYIVTVLVILNLVIFFKYLQLPTLQIDGFGDCLDAFFGYNYGNKDNCKLDFLKPFGQPLASYISPVLFIIFTSLSANQENFNKVLFGSFSFIIVAEYFWFKRWKAITNLWDKLLTFLHR